MRAPVKILYLALLAAVLAVGAFFRLHQLDWRPLHGDEANQAVKTGILYDKGTYIYDPHEHHGPTLYYMALPFLKLSGAASFKDTQITAYRLVPAFCGILLLAVTMACGQGLGAWAGFWAALLLAVSHGMAYYSRYYIQEMPLILFTWSAVFAGWRFIRSPGYGWALLFGLLAGLMHATKETSLPIFMAMGGALFLAWAWDRAERRDPPRWAEIRSLPWKPLLAAAALAAVVSVTFFTSFFTHARGPLDSVLTYATYLKRAEGTGSTGIHDHPWHYYLSLLAWHWKMAGPKWTEAPVLVLALFGAVAAVWPKKSPEEDKRPIRFLLFFTLAMTVGFSLIPYKSPWNMLVFYQGMILLAGCGAAALVRAARWKPFQAALAALFLAGAAFMANQSWLGNFKYPADVRNPYVYAHTSTAALRLVDRVHQIAAVHPEGNRMIVRIIRPGGDYWPLPWYFRDLERVGYHVGFPATPDAAIIISGPELNDLLKEHLKDDYFVESCALRPGVSLQVRIRRDLWDKFMADRG